MRLISTAATALQILATGLLGLMAGTFLVLSADGGPAMLQLDVQSWRSAQQALDGLLHTFPFGIVYFGAVLMPLLAAMALWLGGRSVEAQPWLVIGLVYLMGVFLLTREVSIPMSNALAQWDSQASPAHWLRERGQWDRANLLRCITAFISFAGALAALAVRPRISRPGL